MGHLVTDDVGFTTADRYTYLSPTGNADNCAVQVGGSWRTVNDLYIKNSAGEWEKMYQAGDLPLTRGEASTAVCPPALAASGANHEATVGGFFEPFWNNSLANGGSLSTVSDAGVEDPVIRVTTAGVYYQRIGPYGVTKFHNSDAAEEEWEVTFKYRKVSGQNALVYVDWQYSATNKYPDYFAADSAQVGGGVLETAQDTSGWALFRSRVPFISNANYGRFYITVEANLGATVVDIADIRLRRLGPSLLDRTAMNGETGQMKWANPYGSTYGTVAYTTINGRNVTRLTSNGQNALLELTDTRFGSGDSTMLPIMGGYTYRFSVEAICGTPAEAYRSNISIIWLDSAGSAIDSTSKTAPANVSGWHTITLEATAPATAKFARIRYHPNGTTIPVNTIYYLDTATFDFVTDPPTNRNLLPAMGAGFEGGTTWTQVQGIGASGHQTGFVYRGTGGGYCQWNNSGESIMSSPNTVAGLITPGKRYTGSIWLRPNGITPIGRVSIAWYNSAGTYLSRSEGKNITYAANEFQRLWVNAVAPANAYYARLWLIVTGQVGTWSDFDCAQIEEGMLTAWTAGR